MLCGVSVSCRTGGAFIPWGELTTLTTVKNLDCKDLGWRKHPSKLCLGSQFTALSLSVAVTDFVGQFYLEEEHKDIPWSLWGCNSFKL